MNIKEGANTVIDTEFWEFSVELPFFVLTILRLYLVIEDIEGMDRDLSCFDKLNLFFNIGSLLKVFCLLPIVGVFKLLSNLLSLQIYFLLSVRCSITYNDNHWEGHTLIIDDLLIRIPEANFNGFIAPTTFAD